MSNAIVDVPALEQSTSVVLLVEHGNRVAELVLAERGSPLPEAIGMKSSPVLPKD